MLIYANPSPTPRPPKATTKTRKLRAASKGATTMARKTRSAAQKAATRKMLAANKSRKRHRNPSAAPRKATRRRSASSRRRCVHRNPSFSPKGILGELASMDGLLLLGSAAIAPTAVDLIAEKVVPIQYQSGWTGLLAKAAIAAAAAYALDRYAKQRKAAIGFAVGAGGSLVALAYKTFRAQQALPAAVVQASPATADEIARNPTLYANLMAQGGNDFESLNGYREVPAMAGYEAVPMSGDWESLN